MTCPAPSIIDPGVILCAALILAVCAAAAVDAWARAVCGRGEDVR